MGNKSKLLAVDYATEKGGYTCKVYGRYNKKTKEIFIDEVDLIEDKDTMICGLCKFYDSDHCFCSRHLNWGELVEMDSCQDYRECD